MILPCISDSIKYEGTKPWIFVQSDTVNDKLSLDNHSSYYYFTLFRESHVVIATFVVVVISYFRKALLIQSVADMMGTLTAEAGN